MSPWSGSILMALTNHSLHLLSFRSVQNNLNHTHHNKTTPRTYFATASNTFGSCSHFLRASTLLVFLCGRDSMKMASAHNMPDEGHSCNALAMRFCAINFPFPLISKRIASNLELYKISCDILVMSYDCTQTCKQINFYK